MTGRGFLLSHGERVSGWKEGAEDVAEVKYKREKEGRAKTNSCFSHLVESTHFLLAPSFLGGEGGGRGSDGGDGSWQHLGAALLSVLTVAAIIGRGRSCLQERRGGSS